MKKIVAYNIGITKLEIIQLSETDYCVRKTTDRFLLGNKIEFIDLSRNGTDITYDKLVANITIGSLETCRFYLNANLTSLGL